jgi:hypothetical protein
MTLKRIKRITSYVGHARFLSECDDADWGWIPAQKDIPSPYASQSQWDVYGWNGKPVLVRETAHKQYDVFEVPEQMIRTLHDEQESNYLQGLGV